MRANLEGSNLQKRRFLTGISMLLSVFMPVSAKQRWVSVTNKNAAQKHQAAGRGDFAFLHTSESCDSNHRVSGVRLVALLNNTPIKGQWY